MQVLLPSIQCFVILFTVRNILKERNKEACGQSYQHSAILSYNACVEMTKNLRREQLYSHILRY